MSQNTRELQQPPAKVSPSSFKMDGGNSAWLFLLLSTLLVARSGCFYAPGKIGGPLKGTRAAELTASNTPVQQSAISPATFHDLVSYT